MNTRRPKSRTVFFRIGDDDYSRLKEFCEQEGECISDILRVAVVDFLKRGGKEEDVLISSFPLLLSEVETISKKLETLWESTLAQFLQLRLQLEAASGQDTESSRVAPGDKTSKPDRRPHPVES